MALRHAAADSYPIPKKSKLSIDQAGNINIVDAADKLQLLYDPEQDEIAHSREESPAIEGGDDTTSDHFAPIQPANLVEQAGIIELSIKKVPAQDRMTAGTDANAT